MLRGWTVAGVIIVALAIAPIGRAQTWTGFGTDPFWSTPQNWQLFNPPSNNGSANVIFGPSPRTQSIVNAEWSINSLQFDNPGTSYNIGGLRLTIGNGGINNLRGSDNIFHDLSNPISLGAGQSWSANLRVAGNVANNSNYLTISDGSVVSLSGVLSGAGDLVVFGVMWLQGTAANTYTGTTHVSGGFLVLDKPIGSAANNFGSAVSGPLVINTNSEVELANHNQISDIHPLTINGGTLDMADFREGFVTPVTMTGGQVQSFAFGSFDLHTNLSILPSANPSIFHSNVYVDSARTFNVASGARLEFRSRAISGGTIIKDGGGVMELRMPNTFSGGLTINAGTVEFGHDNSAGTGTLTINGGTIRPNNGNRTLPNNAVIGGSFRASTGFDFINFAGNTTLSTSPTVTVDDGQLNFNLITESVSGRSLTKEGRGTLVLSASFYTGPTIINDGAVVLIRPSPPNPFVNAISGDVVVGDGVGEDILTLLGHDQIADSSQVTINSSGIFNLFGNNELINTLRMTGGQVLGPGNLTVANTVAYSGTTSAAFIGSSLWAGAPFLSIDVANGTEAVDLKIIGTLSGQSVNVTGAGTLELAGHEPTPNSISEGLYVLGGTVLLNNSPNVAAISTALHIGDASGAPNSRIVRLASYEQIDDAASVFVFQDGLLDLAGFNETIARLSFEGGGKVATGSGTLTIAGSGVDTRSLRGGSTTALFSGNLNLGGALRSFFTEDDLALAGELNIEAAISNGAVRKTGPGTMFLGGETPNTYSGDTSVYDGTLVLQKKISNAAIPASLTIGDPANPPQLATVRLAQPEQINNSATITIHPRGTLHLNGQNETVANVLMNGNVDGNAILTASTTFTYNAGIFKGRLINGGTAAFNASFTASNGIANLGSFSVNAGIAVNSDGQGLTNTGTVELRGGTVGGSGPILNRNLITGYGVLRGGGLTNDGNVLLFGGPTTIEGNVTNNGTFKTTSTTVTFSGTYTENAEFISDPSDNYFFDVFLNAPGSWTGGGGDRFFVKGALDWSGGSMSGSAQTFSQGSAILHGVGVKTLNGWEFNNQKPLTMSGGNLDMGNGAIINNTSTLEIQGNAGITNALGGAATFSNQATLRKTGVRTISSIAALVTNNNGNIDVPAGILVLNGGLNIAAATTLAKTGAGDLTISGPQSHAAGAQLTANSGSIHLNSNAGTPATTAAAASATLTLNVSGNNATIALGSNQDLKELNIPIANADNQSLDLSSPGTPGAFNAIRIYAADLAAAKTTLWSAVKNANGPGSLSPVDGIFDSGKFAHAGSAIGLARLTDAHGDPHIQIRLTRLGDLNLDGTVTIADFIELASHFNQTAVTWQEGDLNYDGAVTIADFIDLASQFNTSYSGESFPISPQEAQILSTFAATNGITSVPEPAGLLPILLATMLLPPRRRKSSLTSQAARAQASPASSSASPPAAQIPSAPHHNPAAPAPAHP